MSNVTVSAQLFAGLFELSVVAPEGVTVGNSSLGNRVFEDLHAYIVNGFQAELGDTKIDEDTDIEDYKDDAVDFIAELVEHRATNRLITIIGDRFSVTWEVENNAAWDDEPVQITVTLVGPLSAIG